MDLVVFSLDFRLNENQRKHAKPPATQLHLWEFALQLLFAWRRKTFRQASILAVESSPYFNPANKLQLDNWVLGSVQHNRRSGLATKTMAIATAVVVVVVTTNRPLQIGSTFPPVNFVIFVQDNEKRGEINFYFNCSFCRRLLACLLSLGLKREKSVGE